MTIGKAAIFSGNCNFPTESRHYPDTPRPVMSADLPSGGAAKVGANVFPSRCERPPFIPKRST
jgi:hypothetical protein